ncbi:hypothetical protein IE53DRAFT_412649 [Violaceomyces palustris]|uniref:Uncharacterized protein n=1 Tax=Violaceomyces palustris TaxID=1673888 RepID=A0ACD0NQA9_9BASI|nr:hypothetical protein IE53DRAFT_412649 [Violaceomyces palustris]
MFPRAPRFDQRVPDETPGPNAYDPKEPLAHYKKGLICEKDARFRYPKVNDENLTSSSTTKQVPLSQSTKTNLATSSGPTQITFSSQIKSKMEERISKLEAKLQDVERERSNLSNDKASIQIELRLSAQRETKLRSQLEKQEKLNSQLRERSNGLSSLQSRLDELMKVHEDSKSKRQAEIVGLRDQLEAERQRQKVESSKYQAVARELEVRLEKAESKVKDYKDALASAERDVAEANERLEETKGDLDVKRGEKGEEVERLLSEKERILVRLEEVEQGRKKERERAEERQNELQSLVEDLEREKRGSEGEIRRLKDSLERSDQDLRSLREDLRLERESGNSERVSQLESLQGRLSDEQGRCRRLEEEVRSLEDRLEGLEEENDEQESLWQANLEILAKACGKAVSDLKQSHQEEITRLRYEVHRSRIELAQAEKASEERQSQLVEVVAVVKQVQEERDSIKGLLVQTERDTDRCREMGGGEGERGDDASGTDRLRFATLDQDLEEIDLEAQRIEALVMESELETARTRCDQLSQELDELLQQTLSYSSERKVIERNAERNGETVEKLKKEKEDALREVEACKRKMVEHMELTYEVDRLNQEKEEALRELKLQQEANKTMSTCLGNAKMAERMRLEEIGRLSEELESACQYESLYKTLCTETRHLLSRNRLAESEAASLSALNAELLSHNNPNQKILYMDRVRRELDSAKQEVTALSLELEDQRDLNIRLQAELDKYRSIETPLSERPRAALLRVSRGAGNPAQSQSVGPSNGFSRSLLNASFSEGFSNPNPQTTVAQPTATFKSSTVKPLDPLKGRRMSRGTGGARRVTIGNKNPDRDQTTRTINPAASQHSSGPIPSSSNHFSRSIPFTSSSSSVPPSSPPTSSMQNHSTPISYGFQEEGGGRGGGGGRGRKSLSRLSLGKVNRDPNRPRASRVFVQRGRRSGSILPPIGSESVELSVIEGSADDVLVQQAGVWKGGDTDGGGGGAWRDFEEEEEDLGVGNYDDGGEMTLDELRG